MLTVLLISLGVAGYSAAAGGAYTHFRRLLPHRDHNDPLQCRSCGNEKVGESGLRAGCSALAVFWPVTLGGVYVFRAVTAPAKWVHARLALRSAMRPALPGARVVKTEGP